MLFTLLFVVFIWICMHKTVNSLRTSKLVSLRFDRFYCEAQTFTTKKKRVRVKFHLKFLTIILERILREKAYLNEIRAILAAFASVAPISEKYVFLSIAFLYVLLQIYTSCRRVYSEHTKKIQVLVML